MCQDEDVNAKLKKNQTEIWELKKVSHLENKHEEFEGKEFQMKLIGLQNSKSLKLCTMKAMN